MCPIILAITPRQPRILGSNAMAFLSSTWEIKVRILVKANFSISWEGGLGLARHLDEWPCAKAAHK